nr:uncharacterized protein LOC107423346 isoform X2 [Ziziphus jujuba var. spinosa]
MIYFVIQPLLLQRMQKLYLQQTHMFGYLSIGPPVEDYPVLTIRSLAWPAVLICWIAQSARGTKKRWQCLADVGQWTISVTTILFLPVNEGPSMFIIKDKHDVMLGGLSCGLQQMNSTLSTIYGRLAELKSKKAAISCHIWFVSKRQLIYTS